MKYADDIGRPIICGEYPYYRADPSHWESNLRDLAEVGVDVVTCYVPWRLHETAPGRYDFTGRTDRQRDVTGFLQLVHRAGLAAVVKPGPFIHAEVQFGGLPDRVSPSRNPDLTAVLDADGRPATAQGQSLPSLYGPGFRAEVLAWLAAVDAQVIGPATAPTGPVVGVQVGNEGVYSDANLPLWSHDFAAPAVRAFAGWLRPNSVDLAAVAVDHPPTEWPEELWAAWARWSAQALTTAYRELADCMPTLGTLDGLVNLPLPRLDGPQPAAWLLRTDRVAEIGLVSGYTGWVGNAAREPAAFAAHWFGARARRATNLETNWGFTWDDPAHAEPHTPMFHSLLALGLGSTTCSVYTACATEHWGPEIDLDPGALRQDGLDPADFDPPYCPGAPLREDGGTNPNIAALHGLRAMLVTHGHLLARTRFAADLLLLVTRPLAEVDAAAAREQRPFAARSTLGGVIEFAADLMAHHQYTVDVGTEHTMPAPDARLDIPWLIAVPPGRADDDVRKLVEARRQAGGALLLFALSPDPELSASWGESLLRVGDVDTALRRLPAPRYGHAQSDPGTVLVHEDDDHRPMALFAFNPLPTPVTVRRRAAGTDVVVPLGPGGSACLVNSGSEWTVAAHSGLRECQPEVRR